MEIKKLAERIHDINVEKGFWEEYRNTGEMLMLVVSELAEALEADREMNFADLSQMEFEWNSKGETDEDFKEVFEVYVKNSFEDEIADTIIRLLDISEGMEIDIEKHIDYKLKYNKMREHKHGKNY